jgi:hypothetical protein
MHNARMHYYSDAMVALVCHDATIAMQKTHELMRLHQDGDVVLTGPFQYLHADLMDAAVNGVREARNGEAPSPRQHHQQWKAFLEARGWACGPKDPDAKTHPNLVSWDALTPEQRDKCRVFLGIVASMTIDVGAA